MTKDIEVEKIMPKEDVQQNNAQALDAKAVAEYLEKNPSLTCVAQQQSPFWDAEVTHLLFSIQLSVITFVLTSP